MKSPSRFDRLPRWVQENLSALRGKRFRVSDRSRTFRDLSPDLREILREAIPRGTILNIPNPQPPQPWEEREKELQALETLQAEGKTRAEALRIFARGSAQSERQAERMIFRAKKERDAIQRNTRTFAEHLRARFPFVDAARLEACAEEIARAFGPDCVFLLPGRKGGESAR